MGRVQYLQRLAFGLSAFELPEDVPASGEWRNSEFSSHPERLVGHGVGGEAVQAYDARGRPFDRKSYQYGRSMRQAQNDVLAAIGAVERKGEDGDGPAHQDGLGSARRDISPLAHRTAVQFVAASCLSWSDLLLSRLLVVPYPADLGVSDIVSGARHTLGLSGFLLGRAPNTALWLAAQAICSKLERHLGPLDLLNRLVEARVQSRSARDYWHNVVSKSRLVQYPLALIPRVVRAVVLGPIGMHSILLCLGLVPSDMLFPPLSAFNPWSPSSVFCAIQWTAKPVQLLRNCVCSPAVLYGLWHYCHVVLTRKLWLEALQWLFWHFLHQPDHGPPVRVFRGDESVRGNEGKWRPLGSLGALIARPMAKLLWAFDWAFVLRSERATLNADWDVFAAHADLDYLGHQLEHGCLEDPPALPQVVVALVLVPEQRPTLDQYPLNAVSAAKLVCLPLAHTLATLAVLPLHCLLLRRIATSFVGGDGYLWLPRNGVALAWPQSAREGATWLARTALVLGINSTVHMGVWTLEAWAVFLKYKWTSFASTRKDEHVSDGHGSL